MTAHAADYFDAVHKAKAAVVNDLIEWLETLGL